MTLPLSRTMVWLTLAAFSVQILWVSPLYAQQAQKADTPPAETVETDSATTDPATSAPDAAVPAEPESADDASAAPPSETPTTDAQASPAPAPTPEAQAQPATPPKPEASDVDKWKQADPAADVRRLKSETSGPPTGSTTNGLLGTRPAPDRDRFQLDYAPKEKEKNEDKTPWYKHWALWTSVGLLVCGGVVLGITLGNQSSGSDSLEFSVTRRQ